MEEVGGNVVMIVRTLIAAGMAHAIWADPWRGIKRLTEAVVKRHRTPRSESTALQGMAGVARHSYWSEAASLLLLPRSAGEADGPESR